MAGSADPNRNNDSSRPTRIEMTIRQNDSSRATRIDNSIRVGRPESAKRFESADPNQRNDKSRPARIDKAIRVGRTESLHRFGSETKNDSNLFSVRVGRLETFTSSGRPARTEKRLKQKTIHAGLPELKQKIKLAGKNWKKIRIDRLEPNQ